MVLRKNKKTTDGFITEANNVHSNKYDYSLTDYINVKSKVKIICLVHGEFLQEPRAHLSGQNCPKCSSSVMSNNECFINKAKIVHGNKYDYSLVIYNGSLKTISLICDIHGDFDQIASNHLSGSGCPKCRLEKTIKLLTKNQNELINEFIKIHGDKYNYGSVTYINNRTKINIKCYSHGWFEQRPDAHLMGQGCPICNESKGEKEIREYLIKNNIKYLPEKKFNNCKNIKILPFDFYLPDYNMCIEFDGIQHFKPVKNWGGIEKFIIRKKNDEIKSDYCRKNGIELLRIKYNENIIKKLNKNIC